MKTLIALLFSTFSLSAAPTDDADRAELLKGVKEINTGGLPGGLSVYGPDAFAVVAGKEGDESLLSIAAAARYGKGRIVAFGHDGFLAAVDQNDTGAFLLNAVRWVAHGKPKPTVGILSLFDSQKTVDYLKAKGINAIELGYTEHDLSIKPFDVIITSPMTMSDHQILIYENWLRDGGGLIAGVTGWGWTQLNGGNDPAKLANHCPGNLILKNAGLVFSNSTPGRTLPASYATGGDLSLLNAGTALDALLAHSEGKTILPPARLLQCSTSISDALRALPPDDKILRPRLSSLAGKPHNVPSPSNPFRANSPIDRLILTRDIAAARSAKPEDVKVLEAAYFFPGMFEPETPRIASRTLSIDAAVPQWHGTGLYAPPGEVIRVTLPPEYAGKGFKVRIGCHTDTLWHLAAWKRAPEISLSKPLKEVVTAIASGFGGLIYIDVPAAAPPFKIDVTISGALESPRFVLGETSVDDWKNRIRNFKAPWGELETKKVIFSMPRHLLEKIDDPEALMKFWDRVLDADADLSAIPHERKRPERIVADVQISGGYMHSGYPIMTPWDGSAETATTLDKLTHGSWGHFHELGHNHQQPGWTFDGTGEVTCNLFSLYVMETLCGKAPGTGHEQMEPAAVHKHLHDYLARTDDKFAHWKSDPFLALIMYDQLRAAFGWETYQKVFAEYRALPNDQRPKTDDQKRDQWLVRFSRACGKNLGPFFEAWSVPTSESARKSITDLPGWMPTDWPKP